MKLTRVLLAVGLTMLCCTWVPAFAQSSSTLNLTPVSGTTDTYTDASGNRFVVKPEGNGVMCGNSGCMVKICRDDGKSPCVWFYCTTASCTKLELP